MVDIPNYRALIRHYDAKSEGVRWQFWGLPDLIEQGFNEATLAYSFLRLEQAQNRTLYGALLRLHRADSALVRRILDRQHLTRQGFRELYRNVLGRAFPPAVAAALESAESARDRVVHGKNVPARAMREAVADVLDHAEALNDEVLRIAGFRPCGDMRGIRGSRRVALDKRTTKWLMKGLGFSVRT